MRVEPQAWGDASPREILEHSPALHRVRNQPGDSDLAPGLSLCRNHPHHDLDLDLDLQGLEK